jgi:hypothetical protein
MGAGEGGCLYLHIKFTHDGLESVNIRNEAGDRVTHTSRTDGLA